jgi:hypothetical protein
VWTAAAASASKDSAVTQLMAASFICLEWLTMLSTQLQAERDAAKHWKDNASSSSRAKHHWIVRAMFRNNFRNPMGVLCIFGLFCANLFEYGSNHAVIYEALPWFQFFRGVAMLGRFCAAMFEVTLCLQYLCSILEEDDTSRVQGRTTSPERHGSRSTLWAPTRAQSADHGQSNARTQTPR